MRVLIVDDEPDILLLVRVALEAEGFETALAADGEHAIERLSSEQFDAVVLDVMMPVLDGWGVLEHVQRTSPEAPPVVVVSAKTSDRDVGRALRLGAIDYVTKPFEISALSGTLSELLALSPEARAARRQEKLAQLGDG